VAAAVRASGASRAFIYRLPDIVQQIQKLRDQQAATGQRQPARERASEASKDARIRHLTATVAELRTEINQLRQQNSLLLGRLRENGPMHPKDTGS
jgi:predicted RNase H-like nuclease (RuvC/YqgF family)